MSLVVEAAYLATPDGMIAHPRLLLQDGCIAALGTRDSLVLPAKLPRQDFENAVLAPGFIDIHVHGGAGHDLMSGSPAALASVGRHLARHGVTSFLPTTLSAPWDDTLATLQRLAAAMSEPQAPDAARALALHLEGPFLSPHRRGVHPIANLALPTRNRLDELWEAAQGRIRLLTLAPELPGTDAVIREAAARGIRVSLGHSDADAATARAAVDAGATSVTHTFNAMSPLDHRAPGLAGEALANPALFAEIIADGVHVHPMVVAMFLRLKGADRAILVSDAISATGQGDGRFPLGPIEVEVHGSRCLAEGRLAGSVLTLDLAVRNAMAFSGCDLATAVRLASFNPARMLGLAGGEWNVGAPADVVVLSPNAELRQVYVRGLAVL